MSGEDDGGIIVAIGLAALMLWGMRDLIMSGIRWVIEHLDNPILQGLIIGGVILLVIMIIAGKDQ